VWICPNFTEKTFTNGSQTAKFVNVFSLENLPLCGRGGSLNAGSYYRYCHVNAQSLHFLLLSDGCNYSYSYNFHWLTDSNTCSYILEKEISLYTRETKAFTNSAVGLMCKGGVSVGHDGDCNLNTVDLYYSDDEGSKH
jgi:hypothetical protein